LLSATGLQEEPPPFIFSGRMAERVSDDHPHAGSGLERAATWVSVACALHCLLVPLFAAGLPLAAGASASLLHHPALELAFAAVVLGGAAFTAIWGFRRHRDGRVLALLGVGLGLYALGHGLDGWSGRTLSVVGALLLAAASLTSARLTHALSHGESCAH
jgi:hypothetical protein